MAPRMAVLTLLHLTPRPTWPASSPIMTKALKRYVDWLEFAFELTWSWWLHQTTWEGSNQWFGTPWRAWRNGKLLQWSWLYRPWLNDQVWWQGSIPFVFVLSTATATGTSTATTSTSTTSTAGATSRAFSIITSNLFRHYQKTKLEKKFRWINIKILWMVKVLADGFLRTNSKKEEPPVGTHPGYLMDCKVTIEYLTAGCNNETGIFDESDGFLLYASGKMFSSVRFLVKTALPVTCALPLLQRAGFILVVVDQVI